MSWKHSGAALAGTCLVVGILSCIQGETNGSHDHEGMAEISSAVAVLHPTEGNEAGGSRFVVCPTPQSCSRSSPAGAC